MPKVLRIINRFNLGGPTYNAAYLTKYLSPDFDTMLIGGKKEEAEGSSEFILKNMNVNYTILPEMQRSINPINDFLAFSRIKSIIRDFKPDIVHTHAAKAGAIGRRAAFVCKVPVVIHTYHGHVFHSYFGKFRTSVIKKIERSLAKKTSVIIAISENQKHELVVEHKIATAEKIQVIPLGFDLHRFQVDNSEKRKLFRIKYNLDEDEIAIGIIGRLAPVKNHKLFIEAIKFIKDYSQKKIKAFVVGDGEMGGDLKKMVEALNLSTIVVFTSWEKEIEKIYPGLDIVCLTSFNEGTPVSLIEAQASGKPILSTNVGGIENAVMPGKTALLSEISDKRKFCENLLSVVENEELRNDLSKEGSDFVMSKFQYTRLIADVKSLYTNLL